MKATRKAKGPNFWVGTSGYQYPEWRGKFYPESLSTAKMLGYYAQRFSTTEVNYTFRQIPSDQALRKWALQTPANFRFGLKAPQRITHFAKLRDCGETARFFADRTQSLGAKRGAILFQLPPTFKADIPLLRDFLEILPKDLQSAFEFRHESWLTDEVFSALKKQKAALCIADTDELSTPALVTAPFVYFRLRREDYTLRQLTKWAVEFQKCATRATDAYVYFKHEETGVGPKFAAAFLRRLDG